MYNALYTACKTGNVSAVQQILDDLEVQCTSTETADPADAGKIQGDAGEIPTPISQLLCHRSRNNSTTLLHIASQFGHIAVIRLLLQHGADPSVKYDMFTYF